MRRFTYLMILLSMFLILPAALAQDESLPPVPCGELPATDCDILIASDEVMRNLSSASFDLTMEMGLADLSETTDIVFQMEMNGAYSGDWSQFIENLTPERITAITANPAAYATLVQSMMTSFGMDFDITMSLPDDLLEPGEPNALTFAMVIADGVFYFNFDEIKNQLPQEETADLPDGWVGFDFARWMGLFARVELALEDQEATLDAIEQAIIANRFVTVVREADEQTADGATLAVFAFDYDMAAMLRSAAYRDYLVNSMQQSLDSTMDDSPEVTGEGFNLMLEIMAFLMDGSSITAISKIDTEDFYLHEAAFDFTWESSPVLTGIVGGVRGIVENIFGEFADPEVAPVDGPSMFMRGTISMSDFDSVEPVVAPPDSRVVRFEDLLERIFARPEE